MKYNFVNTLLTENEKKKLIDEANDKLIDILTVFIKESDYTFYSDFRLNNFTNNLLSLNEKIRELDQSIEELNLKTISELQSIAKQYNVEGYETLEKEDLFQAVQKALFISREKLNNDSMYQLNVYTNNSRNTYKSFFVDKIQKLKAAVKNDFNDEHKKQYNALIEDFSKLLQIVNKLQSWIDGISIPITLLKDYKEELNSCKKSIEDYKSTLRLSYDPIELSNALERKQQLEDKETILRDSIETQKENILEYYNNNISTVDFVSIKIEIIGKLMSHAINNANYAFENNILNREDFFVIEDGKEIDKCSRALSSFFSEIIEAQFEFEHFLRDNSITLFNEYKINRSKLAQITEEKEITNNYEIGTIGIASRDIEALSGKINKGDRVQIVGIDDVQPSRGYDLLDLENGVKLIETGYDSIIPIESEKTNDMDDSSKTDEQLATAENYETTTENVSEEVPVSEQPVENVETTEKPVEEFKDFVVQDENNIPYEDVSTNKVGEGEPVTGEQVEPVTDLPSDAISEDVVPSIPLPPVEENEPSQERNFDVDYQSENVIESPISDENSNIPYIPLEPLNVTSVSENPNYDAAKQKAKQAIENGAIFKKSSGTQTIDPSLGSTDVQRGRQ